MQIRALTEADYEQVIELYEKLDAFHAENRPDCFVSRDKEQIYPKEAYCHNLAYPGGLELGAFDGTRLAGIVRATLWEDSLLVKGLKNVCLDNIYVLPEYRRRGIAARLFAQVEEWAKEQGAVRLELHTWAFNREAIALYEGMGMQYQRYVLEKKL